MSAACLDASFLLWPNNGLRPPTFTCVFLRFWPSQRDVVLAEIGLSRGALALAMYGRTNGSYPRRLDHLAVLSGDALKDPFTGAPLHYERTGGGYRLWSVGPNMTDDGGEQRHSGPLWEFASGNMVCASPPTPEAQ